MDCRADPRALPLPAHRLLQLKRKSSNGHNPPGSSSCSFPTSLPFGSESLQSSSHSVTEDRSCLWTGLRVQHSSKTGKDGFLLLFATPLQRLRCTDVQIAQAGTVLLNNRQKRFQTTNTSKPTGKCFLVQKTPHFSQGMQSNCLISEGCWAVTSSIPARVSVVRAVTSPSPLHCQHWLFGTFSVQFLMRLGACAMPVVTDERWLFAAMFSLPLPRTWQGHRWLARWPCSSASQLALRHHCWLCLLLATVCECLMAWLQKCWILRAKINAVC